MPGSVSAFCPTRDLLVEEHRLARELHRKQSLIDGIAHFAAHDLRSPIWGIGHLVDLARSNVASGKTEHALHNLDRIGQRIAALEQRVEELVAQVGREDRAARHD